MHCAGCGGVGWGRGERGEVRVGEWVVVGVVVGGGGRGGYGRGEGGK